MATITTPVYLDGGTARTAGEAMIINSGGALTIRTDTRVHANAPASMTGYLGTVNINEGKFIIDAQNVRWMAFNTGTGNVPAIGATITQGGVSGYLLGVWTDKLSAPTAVAAAMPVSGFIKFREVTGGTFTVGALTGIGASAISPDVPGWIELVFGGVDISVPRLGEFRSRGNWFDLETTTGTRAQVVQVPTNGGGANTYCPGVWVEDSAGSGVYEKWPALNGAANGWSIIHLGAAEGQTDARHKFVKMLSNGQMQFGETVTFASTYASLAAQASTYADWNVAGTYVLTANVCTVYCSAGHGLYGGESVGLDFTSGTATDQTGSATILDAYYFSVPITNANTSGNVTVRLGATVTFAAHGLSEGFQVGLTVSTGTLPTGTYTVHSMATTGVYNILYPHTAVLTSGACSALHTLTVTRTAHGRAGSNQVYLDFTSGGATDGVYTLVVVAANTFTINYPHFAAIATSNVTERYDLGAVPPAGCRVRVPNIFIRSGTTAANLIPNATLTSRPEAITTSAGAVDLEFIYGENMYCRFGQAYSVRIAHLATMDTFEITESATALSVDDVMLGQYTGGNTLTPLVLTSNFAGGSISNSKFFRQGTPGQNLAAINAAACFGITLDSVEFGIMQYARHALGYSGWFTQCSNLVLQDCVTRNQGISLSICQGVTVNSLTYSERLNGYSNNTGSLSAIVVSYSKDVIINGFNYPQNQNPPIAIVTAANSSGLKIRNIGSYASPLTVTTFAPQAYCLAYLLNTTGNNSGIQIQRCFMEGLRGNPTVTLNSDTNITLETVIVKSPYKHATDTVANRTQAFANAFLNTNVKGLGGMVQSIIGQASVYGTHFHDLFMGKTYGQVALCMNEPTVETAAYFSMVSGTAKFTSAGGILMGVIGDQAVWEMPYFALGHTGFVNEAVAMSGGTIGNYTLEYQIDTGSGYSAWKTLNGTNLSGETISPSTGFKLKIRITTTTTNAAAITFLRIRTTTTEIAQSTNFYPLDTNTVTFTGLPVGTEVRVRQGSKTLAQAQDVNTGSYIFSHSLSGRPVRAQFTLPGYVFEDLDLTLVSSDISIGIIYSPDPSYSAS